MLGYYISCIVLLLIILAFIPAMVASQKNRSFVRWHVYGVLLFPVALIHSLLIEKPVRLITVHSSAEDNKTRRKKTYKVFNTVKNDRKISAGYVVMVFAAKLLFGAFVAFVAFAIIRTYTPDSMSLRWITVTFAVLLGVLLSVTEILGLSRTPVIADEMTKRALIILGFSVVISAVMSIVKTLITSNVDEYREFFGFLCTGIAFVVFCIMLFSMQRRYYRIFYSFFDYCFVSIGSYAMYAAVTLVLVTLLKKGRYLVYALSMPMQLFNFSYFSNVRYIENLTLVYSAALVHSIVMALILLSGLQCYSYRKRELAFRAEYRSKAFRMTRRQALRRHIPKAGLNVTK